MSYINPLPPELHGDDITYQVSAGGKPKTATPADRRLKENKPTAKMPAKAAPKTTRKKG
jgi:hypothetical protein